MARSTSRRLADGISIYLPVLLLGVLALGSYWLLRVTPAPMVVPEAAPVRHETDYFMRNFRVQTFEPTGQLKSELMGREIRHFPDNDTLEVDQVRLHTHDAARRLTVVTAQRALSNGDGSEVQFFGDARVVREGFRDAAGQAVPRFELRSDFLHVIQDTERIVTPKPVEILRGADRFTADAMEYDNLNRVVELRGRVVGVMVPGNRR